MKIVKRDGSKVSFDKSKITNAVMKAFLEIKGDKYIDVAESIADGVMKNVESGTTEPNVESIQDDVECALMTVDPDVARGYILYRNERNRIREEGWDMSDLQRDIYEQKYRYKSETFDEFLERVSGGNKPIKKLIQNKKFMPAGRILAGRGLDEDGRKVTMSNCYVMPKVEDNIEAIFDTAKYLARTYSYGGGVGLAISKLRPKGAKVNNSAKHTTGAVSFMRLYDLVTGLIGMRGRRGALMINMDVTHPDIEEFIDIKNDLDNITNANISINITNEFMQAVKDGAMFDLTFTVEATGEVLHKPVNARELFKKIAFNNWNMAEPGMLFSNRINSWHMMSEDEDFEFAGVNPCFTGDMNLLTSDGYKTFSELSGKSVDVVNIDGDVSQGKVWSNGAKDTVKLTLSNNHTITCTPDHTFMTIDGVEIEAKDSKGETIMPFLHTMDDFEDKYVKFGFIQGDSNLGRLKSLEHKGLEVYFNKNDDSVKKMFANDKFTEGDNYLYVQGYNDELRALGFNHNPLPERGLPKTMKNWTHKQVKSFIRGLYSANGSVIKGHRVALKTTSKQLAKQLITILNDKFKVKAYITTNKAKEVEFYNGNYMCKESYDVNISKFYGIQQFAREIGFIQEYKQDELVELLLAKAPYVRSIAENGIEEVFDFSEPTRHWGVVEGFIAHNCAEETLPAFGSCNLASINLSELVLNPFAENAEFNYSEFKDIIKYGVVYLNEILDENMNLHPLQQQREMSKKYRQVGLGLMGIADMFIKLRIKYGSEESLDLINKIGSIFANEAMKQSALLAKEYGAFPAINKEAILKSPYVIFNASRETKDLIRKYGLRNSQLLTIAPTGTISTLIGCSNGVEPLFQISYTRRSDSLNGGNSYYTVYTDVAKRYMEKYNIEKEEDLPEFFVTTPKLDYKDRIDVQSAWQKYIDASISSTVNVPNEFTVEDVEGLYMYAWAQGLKGVTIYRDGCARGGVLTTNDSNKSESIEIAELQAQIDLLASKKLVDNPDECPMCGGEMMHSGGCEECQDCGYSPCAI